ncbi:unnamed protein product [Echinostoma caproni]|uniref:RT_RNaseH_2 domain-containing protein n=1 Tax=Echinostoma caproni TaxID=27848 RepID=A0A183AYR6_9TREM|nr:unnamed protein product [Echinostoma caproni]
MLIRESKWQYELRLAQCVQIKPKKYYTYVQSKEALRDCIGPLITGAPAVIMDDQGKADALAGHFSSVHRTDDGLPRILERGSSPSEIEKIQLSEEIVHQHLEGLEVHEAAGPDEIHPANNKAITDILAGLVYKLYKVLLYQGVLLRDWKVSAVVAVRKGGA